MAEIASLHVERMIPELEQMRRLNLFTPDEVTAIIKKRKEFEHRLERNQKDRNDFVIYISYEVKLLRTIKLRREKLRIFEKKDEIEYVISKRVVKLYKTALQYFKADMKMWLSYINFCTQIKFMNAVSNAFEQMLQVHSEKVNLWLYACRWEIQEQKNLDSALSIIKQALHHHPKSKELYLEAFRLHLLPETPNLPPLKTLFTECHQELKDDIEFLKEVLNLITEHEFTVELQKQICEYLIRNHWKTVEMWHLMAHRELNGHHFDPIEKAPQKQRVMMCLKVYHTGLSFVRSEQIYHKFLETMIDLRKKNIQVKLVTNVMKDMFEEALKKKVLLEQHFIVWAELEEKIETKLEILNKGINLLPESVDLWTEQMRIYVKAKDEKNLYLTAEKAIKTLKNKALPIYQFLLQYKTIKSDWSELKQLFEDGINQEAEISTFLKPLYIEFICVTRNLKTARIEYEKISNLPPFSLELHKKMAELEDAKLNGNNNSGLFLRMVLRRAAEQFGKKKIDVWIDWIKYEMKMDPNAVSNIYNQAKTTLNPELVSAFMAEYALVCAASE